MHLSSGTALRNTATAILQLYRIGRLTYCSPQGSPLIRSMPIRETDQAVENRACGPAQGKTKTAASQDPFTFYRTYLHTNVPLLGDQRSYKSGDDGYTCHSEDVAAHGSSVDDAQPEARGHTAAYKLALRLSNRSNRAPLATIIEQGSYSTLNSHGSLLSVGRIPSLRAAENGSPPRGSRRRSRSLDEKALHDIQEDLAREHDVSTVAVPHAGLNEEHEAVDPPSGTATPLTSYRFERRQSLSSHSGDELIDHEDRGVKGFFRGVMQTVRGVSRTRSRTSSTTHAPIIENRESQLPAYEGDLQLLEHSPEPTHCSGHSRISSIRGIEDANRKPNLEGQARNRTISLPDLELANRGYPHLVQSYSNVSDAAASFSSLLHLLPHQNATRLHEPLSSRPVVYAGTRDVAQEECTAEASTFQNDMVNTSARYTFDGIALYGRESSTLKEANSAKDAFASQNASFCSTMSTSYSRTVLGIDLDLQHDFSHSMRRSQSPPTPVWFTPQMTELERQASYSDSAESLKVIGSDHTQATRRSISSSALPSLLPIAAASGIVRPNYNTPKISFYSPSGNLIQPENCSPPGTSPSGYYDPPTVMTSYYNKQINHSKHSAEEPPIRSPLLPMTTPPTQIAHLPPHLQHHHHNYRHPEQSQIKSYESPHRPVKGCDGVVREDSLTPRSGIPPKTKQARIHRRTGLTIHDLRAEAKFYKARLIASVASQTSIPAVSKGSMPQKRRVQAYNTYAERPHPRVSETPKSGYREGVVGPFAAHALRVCFCQPYDGAGTSTRAAAAGVCLTGDAYYPDYKSGLNRRAKEAEYLLPNARVVGSNSRHSRRSRGADSSSRSPTDSMRSSLPHRASYACPAKRKVG